MPKNSCDAFAQSGAEDRIAQILLCLRKVRNRVVL